MSYQIYKHEIAYINNNLVIYLFNNNEFVFYYVDWNKIHSKIIEYLLDNNICEIKKTIKPLNNRKHYLFKLTSEFLVSIL